MNSLRVFNLSFLTYFTNKIASSLNLYHDVFPILSPLLASGESSVRVHQEGDRSVPAVCAGLPAGEAADSALQPYDGSVGADRPAHAAGGGHTEPQAQTLGAERVLRQGL